MKKIFYFILVFFITSTTKAQNHNYLLGVNFSFDYNKNESSFSGNNNIVVSSNNNTSFLFGGFVSKKLMIGGGVGLNTSKFLSDDGTNVFEESAAGFNIYPDVRYYIPLKKFSFFMEGLIYLGYSEKSNEFNRPTTSFDNGIRLKSGLGVFINKFYLEASITILNYNKVRTSTPVDNTSERINNQTSFEMLKDFTNIGIGVFYHFGKPRHNNSNK